MAKNFPIQLNKIQRADKIKENYIYTYYITTAEDQR